MSEKLIILLLSGTLLMTGVMALSWEPGRDRTLTLGLVLVAAMTFSPVRLPAVGMHLRQRLRRMQRNRE